MRVAAIALIIMLSAGAATGADTPPTRLLAQINTLREQHGLAPLRMESRLATAASDHAAEMDRRDFFDHRGPGGPGRAERVTRAGYDYSRVVENIAAGQERAPKVVSDWMLSAGHRRNLLNAEVLDAGIGYIEAPDDSGDVRYRRYWVAIFGRRSR